MNFAKSIMISMVEKHKGYIVNIGLGEFGRPCPYFSLNAAIHTAFKILSESMYYEMMKYNVNVEYMEIESYNDDDKNQIRTIPLRCLAVTKMIQRLAILRAL